MKKISLVFAVNFMLLCGLSACNTAEHNKNSRKVASLESETEFNERFDAAFADAFAASSQNNGLISKVSATDPSSNALSSMLLNSGIKEALKAEFAIADEYQKVSDQTYADCLEGRKTDPNFECVNIMDTEVYQLSMATWMYSDYSWAKAKAAYFRLLKMIDDSIENKLVNRISLQTGSEVSKISSFAKTFKTNFENGLQENVEKGFAYVSNNDGSREYRRGAMNTLDYAAQAELAAIINEVSEERGLGQKVDINLPSLYRINADSYKREAETGEVQPEELQVFKDLIKEMTPTRQQREIASIGWHDVHGRTFQQGEFALTYDDGPKKSTTGKLLDYLSSRAVENQLGYKPHATFFWQAMNARRSSNAGVVAQAKRLGYGLASHSYSHEDFAYFVKGGQLRWNSRNKEGKAISLKQQLIDAKSMLEEDYGTQLNYFRLPYASGRNTKALQREIGNNNMVHIFWNINSDDWRWRSLQKKGISLSTLSRNYIREIEKAGRGVILLHDIHENTVGPLTQALINHFAKNKNRYKIVPLEEGIQETFINIPANGRLPSNIVRQEPAEYSSPAEPENKPVEESPFPHTRKIIASNLNVRTGPSSSNPVCGVVRKNYQVYISGQNGWFIIDTAQTAPDPLINESFHRCGAAGYIHNGANYSIKSNESAAKKTPAGLY